MTLEPDAGTRPPIIIPQALQPLANERRWVVWKLVRKKGTLTKPPFRADDPNKYASNDDPATWCDLKTAMRAYNKGRCAGIGFALSDITNISFSRVVAFDIDDCRNAVTSTIDPWAEGLLRRAVLMRK